MTQYLQEFPGSFRFWLNLTASFYSGNWSPVAYSTERPKTRLVISIVGQDHHWTRPRAMQVADEWYYYSTCIRCASNSIQIDCIWFTFQRVFHLWIEFERIPLLDSNFSVKFDTIIKYSIRLFWDRNRFWFYLYLYLKIKGNRETILPSLVISNYSKMLKLMLFSK